MADPGTLRPLTGRELDVLHGLADGCSGADLAERLFIGESTVKTHLAALLKRLGARSRGHAVALGYQTGLLFAPHGVCCQAAIERWLRRAADQVAGEAVRG